MNATTVAIDLAKDAFELDYEDACVFHAMPVAVSTACRSVIPRDAGHRFHGMPVGV